ncbi:MAG: hypothetical protein GX960_11715 [Actinomycetales bacterium]|nr:hypothetical protein [Actinomycetales bacterium]
MADWRTYAKAARNTARKQAPEARDAAKRASGRAGDYVRAAGRAIEEGRREDDRPDGEHRRDAAPREGEEGRRPADPERVERPEPAGGRESAGSSRRRPEDDRTRTATAQRPTIDGDRLRKDAAAYYTVASRRVGAANLGPRILRALRDALMIGLSLFIIWGVLAAAGIPIPFTTVLIIVGVIVAISFGGGVYAQWRRARQAREDPVDPQG